MTGVTQQQQQQQKELYSSFYMSTWLGYGAKFFLSNTTPDVALKVFCRCKQYQQQLTLSRLSSILWQISINQLKALRAKTEGSWGRWNSTSPLELKSCLSFHPANLPCGFRPKNLISTLTWISNLPAYPSDFVLARSHNCMSPLLKISLFIYILLALFL